MIFLTGPTVPMGDTLGKLWGIRCPSSSLLDHYIAFISGKDTNHLNFVTGISALMDFPLYALPLGAGYTCSIVAGIMTKPVE